MPAQEVHWYEGMFVLPQHFQSNQQFVREMQQRDSHWQNHYDWGLHSLEIQEEALATYHFRVSSLAARFQDNTLLSIPEDIVLGDLDIREALENENSIDIFLTIPTYQPTRANVATERSSGVRYLVESRDVEDDCIGSNPRAIDFRLPNAELRHSGQSLDGREAIQIARILRSDRVEALPVLDKDFIPPILSCDAYPTFLRGYLEVMHSRLGRKLEVLSSRVNASGGTFESTQPGDRLCLEQLRIIAESYPVLGAMLTRRDVRASEMYTELCRVVGKLTLFAKELRGYEPPAYVHNNLQLCFTSLRTMIDTLLDEIVEPDYEQRAFINMGMRLQVALEPSWLEQDWDMLVGVTSNLPDASARQLVERELDLKIGSSENVDTIFRRGEAGLRFANEANPPRLLPTRPGLTYYRIERSSQPEEWQAVARTLTLALRLRENVIVEHSENSPKIRINTRGQVCDLTFTLYLAKSQG